MLTAVDNLAYLEKLTNDIVNNPEKLNGMHVNTLSQLTNYAVATDDFRVLALLTEIHTGIPMESDSLPEWWLSNFHDDISKIHFKHQKKVKEIRWCDITLDDNEPLTSEKHQPLLNAFKHWLIACDNPLDNGGKLTSSKSAARKYSHILTLINTILLNGQALKLSQYHLEKVSEAFWLNVLLTIGEHAGSISTALYQTHDRIKALLDNVEISIEEVNAFKAKYPYVTRDIASDENTLNLNDRVKACCWLHQQRYYANKTRDKFGHRNPQGNNTILTAKLFEGKILTGTIQLSPFPELALKPTPLMSEYQAVPNQDKGNGCSAKDIQPWHHAIQLINTNIDKHDVSTFSPVTSKVSVDAVQSLTTLRNQGRTRTLPPEFVFDLFRNSYELLEDFCPAPDTKEVNFFDNLLDVLTTVHSKSTAAFSNTHRPYPSSKAFNEALHRDLPQTELGHFLKFNAIDLIHPDFKQKGITQLEGLPASAENRHTRIRHNESMLEIFTVLQGAIQLVLGATIARRQGEMVQLKPFGNLVFNSRKGQRTTDASPYIEDSDNWHLRFKAKKTGVKGENITIDRPVPLSVARFVYQLEQFNRQAIERGIATKNALALFNHIDTQTFQLNKRNSNGFNDAFDALCDYFETAIVEMDNGEYRRHYVRQHQLRRFFALVFFWSKNYENMEALRWMLAHSDLEHLHNYITESDTGGVLNSAKASVIVQSVISDKSQINNLDEVEHLRKILAKRLTGNANKALHIRTLDDAIYDYGDESEHSTIPHISQLQTEQDLENEVLMLLESDIISLNPEFFTIKDENGEDIKTFNLILKINELEAE
ncbi:integrase [Photobacterium sp. GB-36]|uniref:integrase n=1 Tax=Photobacterium sp. GB-36 TaxID=2022108 RepID=UPI000D152703|nr:integrase [Photobacterium sp. GB-36]PSV41331.1 integrase [Photobacterium sp. GB-36]